MAQKDYYKTLGVDKKASYNEIRKAYHKLAVKHHPDHNPDDKTADHVFKEINEAYEVLSDSDKRREYDTFGSSRSNRQRRQEDIFRTFNAGGNYDSGGHDVFRSGQQKGSDLELETDVSFRDAVLGGEQIVEFRRNGRREEIKVMIPAGVDNGSRVRITGKGAKGIGGGDPGDLILTLHIMTDPIFTRNGADLFVDRSIPITAARLGTSLDVPTMVGDTRIKVPAGIQSGTKIRLKGCGVKTADVNTQGDLYVRINIREPEFLNTVDMKDDTDILSQYSVIMVDDEQYILRALHRIFRREPYKFLCANSGAEGLRLLAVTTGVAVIVSDQRMPSMNGSMFLTLSKVLAPESIRMLFTSYSDVESTVAAMNEGGATHYIKKPWDDSELLQIVRDSVIQYHLLMENRRQQDIINQQNEELSSWNRNLKDRVLAQTTLIRKQVEEQHAQNRRHLINVQGVIETLTVLAEQRAPTSRIHALNTATLSIAMAQSLGLPANDIETIRIAALLHDIGKNAISDISLVTGGENDLNEEEWGKYFKHPVLGQIALDSIRDLQQVGMLIRHHHERYDGSGFPDGLSGAAIPLGAAIIAMANSCDREIKIQVGTGGVERALEKVTALSGTAFAPQLIPHLSKPAHKLYDRQFANNDDQGESN